MCRILCLLKRRSELWLRLKLKPQHFQALSDFPDHMLLFATRNQHSMQVYWSNVHVHSKFDNERPCRCAKLLPFCPKSKNRIKGLCIFTYLRSRINKTTTTPSNTCDWRSVSRKNAYRLLSDSVPNSNCCIFSSARQMSWFRIFV